MGILYKYLTSLLQLSKCKRNIFYWNIPKYIHCKILTGIIGTWNLEISMKLENETLHDKLTAENTAWLSNCALTFEIPSYKILFLDHKLLLNLDSFSCQTASDHKSINNLTIRHLFHRLHMLKTIVFLLVETYQEFQKQSIVSHV